MSDLPALPAGYSFHHIGYACADMARERAQFAAFGYQLEGAPFEDQTQGVAGCFLTGPGPRIELLENLPGRDTLTPWLNAGIKMYHFAYLVDDMDAALAWARANRGKVTVAPVPAIAFGGRHIAFAMFRNGMLLEFIAASR